MPLAPTIPLDALFASTGGRIEPGESVALLARYGCGVEQPAWSKAEIPRRHRHHVDEARPLERVTDLLFRVATLEQSDVGPLPALPGRPEQDGTESRRPCLGVVARLDDRDVVLADERVAPDSRRVGILRAVVGPPALASASRSSRATMARSRVRGSRFRR